MVKIVMIMGLLYLGYRLVKPKTLGQNTQEPPPIDDGEYADYEEVD